MPTEKYGFRIRAQNGALVERIMIHAASEEESRKRLFRMYPRSEILSSWREGCEVQTQSNKSFEELADLLSNY